MATVLDELLVKLGFETDVSAIESFNNSIDNIAVTAGRVSLALSVAGSVLAAAMGKGILDTASEFEQFETRLTTIEGSAEKAKASLDWISDFGARTPYDVAQVTEAFVKLKSYGLDPINDNLLESLGNTAAAMGKPLEQGVEAIADAVRGENERLKEFGIIGSKNGNKITYTYDYDGKSYTKEVENTAQEIQGALQEIFDQKFDGGMVALSKTWEGMLSNMGDQWTAFKRRMAERGAFDKLKSNLRGILDYLEENADAVNALADKIGDKLTAALNALNDALFDTWDYALYVRDAFKELDAKFAITEKLAIGAAIAVSLLASNLALFAGAKVIASIQSLLGLMVALANPFALALIAVVLLAAAIEDIYGFLNGKDSIIGGLLKDYPQLQGVITLFKQIASVFNKVWTDNEADFKELFNAILGLVNAFAPVLFLLIDMLPSVFAFLLDVALLAIEGISLAVGALAKFFTGFANIVTVIWTALWSALSFVFEGFFDSLIRRLKSVVNMIRDVVRGIRLIMDGDVIDGLVTTGRGIIDGLGGVVTGSSGGYSGKGSVSNSRASSYQNNSSITQQITVSSAEEASLIASRTAQATRQSNYSYL